MRDRNIHNHEDASNQCPEPDIAVNDAWLNMEALLDDDKKPGAYADKKPRLKRFGFLLLIACIAGLSLYLFNIDENENPPIQKSTVNNQVQKGNKTDSFTETTTAHTGTIENLNNQKAPVIISLKEKKTGDKTQDETIIHEPLKINSTKPSINNSTPAAQQHVEFVPENNSLPKENTAKNNKGNLTKANPTPLLPVASVDNNRNILLKRSKSTEKNIPVFNQHALNNTRRSKPLRMDAKRKGRYTSIIKEQDDAYKDAIENADGHKIKNQATKNENSFQKDNYRSAVSKKRELVAASIDEAAIAPTHYLFTDSVINEITGQFPLTMSNLQADSSEHSLKKSAGKAKSGKNKNASLKNKNTLQGFSYGLQWNASIPLQGFNNYFTSASGKSAPYNMLIPGVWASKALGKKQQHSLQLQFAITTQLFGGNKSIADTSFYSPADSSVLSNKINLVKTSGYSAGIQYNYAVNSKWNAGAGVYYYRNSKALVSQQTTKLTTGQLIDNSTYGISKSAANWQYLSNYTLLAKFEVGYQFKKYEIGTAVFIPFTNQATNPNLAIRPLNAQLFFKWVIK
ncbi:MAG: hypothetical protein QM726_23900 [Chitinophagaceae bacterium]